MLAQLLSFAAGLFAFILYATVFLILMRLKLKVDWFALQFIAGSIVHIISSIFFFYVLNGFFYWYALGVFSFCWFLFFTLSTAIYVSILARILLTIKKKPTRSL